MAVAKKRKYAAPVDLSTPAGVEWFRKAADRFNKKVNRTPETALAQLVKEGILTKSGRLSKNYR
jgi:hypothetical protein